MNNGELIISLAKQGGVELDEAQTKVIKEMTIDLPGDVATNIQGSLFTVESALANPDIINKLKAESLDAVDQKMQEFAKTLGLDDGFIHNLKETKGTYNRIDSVGKAILQNQTVALEKAKEGAPKGDQKELQAEIEKLNKQIAVSGENIVTKTDHEDMVEGFEDMLKENAKAMLNLKANTLFANQNWAMDVDPEVNLTTAQTLFNGELAAKGIKLVDDNGILKLQTGEGTPYFVDNKEVKPQDFANTLLAGKKLLKVTDPAPTPTPIPVPGGGDGTDPAVQAAMLKAAESVKNIQNLQEQNV
ncbi:hypothetical protein LCGC14_0388710 [marine sediment metagenome]|uniref:Uncharacterized protein n=1 Tax=marine sediment metagenome TaxID=412755 RepID=A0A0F9T603_9ZZZZ